MIRNTFNGPTTSLDGPFTSPQAGNRVRFKPDRRSWEIVSMSKFNTSDHLCFPVHAVDLSLAHAPVKVRPSPHVHTARGCCVDEKVVN